MKCFSKKIKNKEHEKNTKMKRKKANRFNRIEDAFIVDTYRIQRLHQKQIGVEKRN